MVQFRNIMADPFAAMMYFRIEDQKDDIQQLLPMVYADKSKRASRLVLLTTAARCP